MEQAMARSSAEIVASLPEADRVFVAEKMAELDRKIDDQRKFDAAIVDSLIRILKSPLGKTLREKIQEIATND
jgi:hypothetical protein